MKVVFAPAMQARDNPVVATAKSGATKPLSGDFLQREKQKMKDELGIGLTFVGLAFISPSSVLSASNSSRFSYMNFIRDKETEASAREAMETFRQQSWIVGGVLGVMAFAATKKSVGWAIATFIAGGITTELMYADMMEVIDRAARRNVVVAAAKKAAEQAEQQSQVVQLPYPNGYMPMVAVARNPIIRG